MVCVLLSFWTCFWLAVFEHLEFLLKLHPPTSFELQCTPRICSSIFSATQPTMGFLSCGLGAVYLGLAQLLLFCVYTDSSPGLVPV